MVVFDRRTSMSVVGERAQCHTQASTPGFDQRATVSDCSRAGTHWASAPQVYLEGPVP